MLSLNEKFVKKKWTKEEDDELIKAVSLFGNKNWNQVQNLVPNRTAHQCRERYVYIHDPNINKSDFTYEEDVLILKLQKIFGNKWSLISTKLEGRTSINIKNRFQTLKKKEFNLNPLLYITKNKKKSNYSSSIDDFHNINENDFDFLEMDDIIFE